MTLDPGLRRGDDWGEAIVVVAEVSSMRGGHKTAHAIEVDWTR